MHNHSNILMSSSRGSNLRLQSLDFLRGIAILGVIAVHTSQAFPSMLDPFLAYGRFGVQLFYFISAFTMCYMWEKRHGRKPPSSEILY